MSCIFLIASCVSPTRLSTHLAHEKRCDLDGFGIDQPPYQNNAPQRYPLAREKKSILKGSQFQHAMVEGKVNIEFIVEKDGTVKRYRIIESSSFSNRYKKSYPGFFDDVAIEHLTQRQYPPRKERCFTSDILEWKFDLSIVSTRRTPSSN